MSMSPAARGRIGGLTRAALAPDRKTVTQAARDGRWQRYVDKVRAALPELEDEAEITCRAEALRRADMIRMSARAVQARQIKKSNGS
jgi:hypothetical protein